MKCPQCGVIMHPFSVVAIIIIAVFGIFTMLQGISLGMNLGYMFMGLALLAIAWKASRPPSAVKCPKCGYHGKP